MTIYHDLVTVLGPVASYRMAETSGTVCNDSAGSSNGTYQATPTLNKNSLLFGDFENGSVDFEASSSQYVSFTGNELTDAINGAAAVAIEIWATVEAFAASLYAMNLVINSTNDGLNLLFDASGVQIGARSVTGDTLQTLHYNWTTVDTIAHFVVIADFANDALYIFKDGVQVAQAAATFTNTAYTKGTPSANDTIARGQTAANYYDGKLCNVNLYNKALTPLQIRQLYSAGTAKGFDAEVMKLSSLAAYWTLGESSGVARDWSGNQNNGTVTGAVQGVDGALVSTLNKDDTAYDFDGTDDEVVIPDHSSLDLTTALSAAAWIKPDDLSAACDIITKWGASPENAWAFRRTLGTGNEKLRFYASGDGSTSQNYSEDTAVTATGVWEFVVVTYNAGAIKLYRNGVEVAGTNSGTIPTSLNNSTAEVTIGNLSDDAGNTEFDGPICKVPLTGSVLTAAQIRTLYQSGIIVLIDRGFAKVLNNLSPAGYWRLGEGADRGIVFDDSGNDNDGVPTSVTFAEPGGVHQDAATATLLDGAAGDIAVTDEASIQNLFDGAGGTVLALIKAVSDGEGNAGRIADKRGASGTGWAFFVSGESGGSVKIGFHHDFSTTDGAWESTGTDVMLNKWVLVAVTYDSDLTTNDPVLYVDGASVAVTEVTTPVGTRVSDVGSDLLIGNDDAGALTFEGSNMHVSVLASTLTAQQIKQVYEAFRSRFAAEVLSKQPDGYWRGNEPSGTTATDYGSGANDGTYTNGPVLAQADTPITNEDGHTTVDYDGSNDHATMGDVLDTDNTNSQTILAFIKTSAVTAGAIIGKMNNAHPFAGFDLNMNADGTLRYHLLNTVSTNGIRVNSGLVNNNGAWRLVAVTYDGSQAASGVNFFANALNEPNRTITQDNLSATTLTSDAFQVVGRVGGAYFDGLVCEVAKDSSVFTVSDILDILEMATHILGTLLPTWQLPMKRISQSPPTKHFIRQIGI